MTDTIKSKREATVKAFLLHWWQHKDNPQGYFKPSSMMTFGLCTNLINWCEQFNLPIVSASDTLNELLGGKAAPFNESYTHYVDDSRAGIQHLNQKRRDWVEQYLTAQCLI